MRIATLIQPSLFPATLYALQGASQYLADFQRCLTDPATYQAYMEGQPSAPFAEIALDGSDTRDQFIRNGARCALQFVRYLASAGNDGGYDVVHADADKAEAYLRQENGYESAYPVLLGLKGRIDAAHYQLTHGGYDATAAAQTTVIINPPSIKSANTSETGEDCGITEMVLDNPPGYQGRLIGRDAALYFAFRDGQFWVRRSLDSEAKVAAFLNGHPISSIYWESLQSGDLIAHGPSSLELGMRLTLG